MIAIRDSTPTLVTPLDELTADTEPMIRIAEITQRDIGDGVVASSGYVEAIVDAADAERRRRRI